ncbi:unnamed protein product [Cylicocyclus nassatus]|uniref:Uncharacterized protein n=1 Tax=Cylicocyclus nassatus TaxID=53992 RepID=A0AA36M904_CYLNA|nr:unnamed protein product [Cylicocyclus nassatus]
MLRIVFFVLVFCLTTAGLDYKEQLWVRNFQHTTYEYALKNFQRLRQRYALILFARGQTTPSPILSMSFVDNSTKQLDNSSYINVAGAFSPPRTIDDDIGLPLNQPANAGKVSFNRYLDPYLMYKSRNTEREQ